MDEQEVVMTTEEMLDTEIRKTLEELDDGRIFTDESAKPILDKLKVLHSQRIEERKLAIEQQKIDNERDQKKRELELKEQNDKLTREIEEKKLKEQRRSNTTTAVIGGVTAATGIAGILATLHCFKKGVIFEQTGSYTSKSGQVLGGLKNLFRR